MSVFCSALYAKCPYFVVIYMQVGCRRAVFVKRTALSGIWMYTASLSITMSPISHIGAYSIFCFAFSLRAFVLSLLEHPRSSQNHNTKLAIRSTRFLG